MHRSSLLVPGRKSARRAAGDGAEDAVATRLVAAGWTILARNVRVGRSELDIIARDPGHSLVIIEVRSRSAPGFGAPEESVDRQKVARLYAAAWQLLRSGDLPAAPGRAPPFRVDLVTVVRDGPHGTWRLRCHIEGLEAP